MKLEVQKVLELLEVAKRRMRDQAHHESIIEYELEPAIKKLEYLLSRLD